MNVMRLFLCGEWRAILGLMLLACVQTVHANVLYSGAPTYPIVEVSMTTIFQNKLTTLMHSNQWKAHLESLQTNSVTGHVVSESVLTPTVKPHTFYYDPSVFVPTAITTPMGRIMIRCSTLYNPLKTIHLNETLIFYDGNDPGQVQWASKEKNKIKVNGKMDFSWRQLDVSK